MTDNEIHIGWIKTLDPKYQSLFYGTYFYLFLIFVFIKTMSHDLLAQMAH